MRCGRIFALIGWFLFYVAVGFGAGIPAQAAGGDAKAVALSPNVVKITATLGQGSIPQTGFGFIVGQLGNQLVVITADHVVRGDDPGAEDQAPLITFFENQGSQLKGKLETVRLPKERGDLAVILVPKPGFVSFMTEAIDTTPVSRGDPVWLIGRDGEWNIPAAPGVIAKVDWYNQIQVEGLAARAGSSGGPLVSSNGIIGMIVRDGDLYTEVTPIEPIRRQISENWHYAWQLGPVKAASAQGAANPAEKVAIVVPTPPPTPSNCGGNSDTQIIRPIALLYQAVNQRNIDLYAEQWADDATYRDIFAGLAETKQEKIKAKQENFGKWETVSLTMDRKPEVLSKSNDHAEVQVMYSMTFKFPGQRPLTRTGIQEKYDVRCDSSGRWLIKTNIDEINFSGSGR